MGAFEGDRRHAPGKRARAVTTPPPAQCSYGHHPWNVTSVNLTTKTGEPVYLAIVKWMPMTQRAMAPTRLRLAEQDAERPQSHGDGVVLKANPRRHIADQPWLERVVTKPRA